MRTELTKELRTHYLDQRLAQVDADFLEFEEETAPVEDLQLVYQALSPAQRKGVKLPNTHNSCILYVLGLTDDFDFLKARSDTKGGSPPDIDMDFDALERQKAINWVKERWGEDQVSYIITHGRFKAKSTLDSYFRVNELDRDLYAEIKKRFPAAKFGKEPKLEKIVKTHPELATDEQYADWYQAATRLENMVKNFGVHAAGIVISDFPIRETLPVWMKDDKEKQPDGSKKSIRKTITQYDMKETEELGLIKFDFLGIDNLSILKEACLLVKQNSGVEIDIYDIPDGDRETYTMMRQGLLTGVFQMETSGSAKKIIQQVVPNSIEETSDISALNRPGPMSAGLVDQYIQNKNNGYPPADLPPKVAKVLEKTYWTLVYQEQVMALCTELAGFTLRESDDVRRAMGKKKIKELSGYRAQFIRGLQDSGLSEAYAVDLWITLAGDPEDPDNNGFADYCLVGDTEIQTLYGPITIGEIVHYKYAVPVLTQGPEGIQLKKVSQWFDRGTQEVYTYEFDNGRTITCTPDHKFMTTSGQMVSITEALDHGLDLMEHP